MSWLLVITFTIQGQTGDVPAGLMKPDAEVFYVCYTPMPVYFCLINRQFRLEVMDGVHWVGTLREVWDLAKAL